MPCFFSVNPYLFFSTLLVSYSITINILKKKKKKGNQRHRGKNDKPTHSHNYQSQFKDVGSFAPLPIRNHTKKREPGIEVRLSDQKNDSAVFQKFLEEMKKYKGTLVVGFFLFEVTMPHAEQLLKVIATTPGLRKVEFRSNIIMSDVIRKQLIKDCQERNVELEFQ